LSSVLGEDYIAETENIYADFINSSINKFYRQIKDGSKFFPNGTNLLEQEIRSLSDSDIQKMLRRMEFSELVLIINGSSAYVSERILKNTAKKYADNIAEIIAFGYDCKRYDNVESIIQAQNKILSLCKHERHEINK